ncbi:MAG: carbohydrate kinase, partial [Tabrizicola sp.]
VLETYAEVGASPARVLAVGGGTKNQLWLQATSDFAGVAQHVCEKTIGASYGDAFLAACAIGAARPQDIQTWNPEATTVQPEQVPAYATQYPLWKRLYTQTRDLMQALP